MKRSVACIGDVTDVRAGSGLPYFLWKNGVKSGLIDLAWQLPLANVRRSRLLWNLRRVLTLHPPGGFQYSAEFHAWAERQIPAELWSTEVITFSQIFPNPKRILASGGRIVPWIDATMLGLFTGRGLMLRVAPDSREQALEREREIYAAAPFVIAKVRWVQRSLIEEYGLPEEKVRVLLPGANLDLPADWQFKAFKPGAGRERDFVLGLVGTDWRRKGLPLLIQARNELTRRGYKVRILAIGPDPDEVGAHAGLELTGYLDKLNDLSRFIELCSSVDLGCLFSSMEGMGMSLLEFLRLGVPVAGFDHQGVADLVPPDAGLRFKLGTSPAELADALELYMRDEEQQKRFRENARRYSKLVSWDRAIAEFNELFERGRRANPFQIWRGLDGVAGL